MIFISLHVVIVVVVIAMVLKLKICIYLYAFTCTHTSTHRDTRCLPSFEKLYNMWWHAADISLFLCIYMQERCYDERQIYWWIDAKSCVCSLAFMHTHSRLKFNQFNWMIEFIYKIRFMVLNNVQPHQLMDSLQDYRRISNEKKRKRGMIRVRWKKKKENSTTLWT